MNKVKFLRDDDLERFELRINDFCNKNNVIATQFLQVDKIGYVVAIWYKTGAVKL